ncbi:MAG TPA: ABC transporter substrate-binding protein [Solirubrobacterales bacterium]|jgi:putative hydroxymethylpyrimidine transport system substrate-binding protein
MKMGCCVLALGVAAALLPGCGGENETNVDETQATHMKRSSEPQDTTEASPERSPKPRKKPKAPKPSPKLRSLNVTLDGYEGPENVGIVMAVERGYFEDAGLDVGIVFAPASPLITVKYIVDRSTDIAVTNQPQVAIAKDKKAPIVAVDTLVRQPTAAMIWLRSSGISDIADLKGKTIAIPGLPFQREFLKSILKRAGLTLGDVKVEFVGYDLISSLVSGSADAIFGGSWNVEGIELKARGMHPVVTRAKDLGLPAYDELVLITRTDYASKKPKVVRDFIAAVTRGTAAAIKDPKGAIEAIEKATEANFEATPNATKAGVKATLPLLSKSGYISPDQANKLVGWMFEEGMIQSKPATSALQTNAYR